MDCLMTVRKIHLLCKVNVTYPAVSYHSVSHRIASCNIYCETQFLFAFSNIQDYTKNNPRLYPIGYLMRYHTVCIKSYCIISHFSVIVYLRHYLRLHHNICYHTVTNPSVLYHIVTCHIALHYIVLDDTILERLYFKKRKKLMCF